MLKKLISVLITVVMVIGLVPIAAVPAKAAGKTLAQLRADFPDGSYWNHYVSKAEESSNYYRDNDKWADAHSNSVSNTACWSHEVSGYDPYKGHYDCNRFGGATQCKGFAYKLGYCAYGTMPTSWGNGTKSTLKAGDVLVYADSSTDPTWGHTVFVIGRSGSTVTVAECNWGGNCKIKWGRSINLNSITIKEIFSAPYTLDGGSVTTHTVDSSYSTNFTAYPKAKITAENIFIDANHTQASSGHWIGTSDLCTIHEVYTDGCCKVTYPATNGTKTVYSKISLFRASVPSVKYWVSSTAYGDEVNEGIAGNSYYLCYYLYDKISKKDWDEVVSSDYEIRLTIYNPDGSVNYTNENKFDYDRSWIRSFFGKAGTYRVELSAVAGYSGSSSKSFVVKENPIKVNCSTNSASLKLGETESKTIYVGYGGYYDGNWVLNKECSNSNVICTWGEGWTDDHRYPLTIKANAMGTTTVTIAIKDKATGSVLDSTTITVTVGAKSYTVSYNANGGSGAPESQTKYHDTTLTLSSSKPKKDGYTFLGWSTSSTATSATYQHGGSFTENANTPLYAVWKQGCESGSHSFSFKVTKAPTTSATGTLTRSCSKCPLTATITLPKLTTTDYNYTTPKAATCTAAGMGRYTWKTTTYGSFYFDVSIAKLGHSYTAKVTAPTCTAQGYTTHTCSRCSDSYKDTYTSATGHSYSYKATKTPTASATGALTGTCSKCSATTTVTLPKLNTTDYSYTVTKGAACIAAGTGRYTWKTTTYGSFSFDVSIAKLGHSYTTKVTAPTCTAQGYTTHTCSRCSDSYKDTYTNATGHSYGYKATKTPTVSATGALTGTCSKCSSTTTVTLPKLNTTDYSYTVTKGATCIAAGTGRYTWKITTYGSFYFDVSIAKLGHSYTAKVTAPTCTAQGYTTHTCSRCSDSYKDTYTNATGHSYSYKATKAPTTSATGTLTGTCSKCSGTTTVTLPKLDTASYSYSVRTAATCTATGTGRYIWKTTAYGSFYFDVSIAKLGHSYTAKVTAATCTAPGYTTHTCSRCSDSYKDTYTNATGHSYGYKATKTPTVSATGALTGTCSKCSSTTTVTLPKLNTTDYSYTVTKGATCTESGTGRYTWKITNYGSVYCNVTIAKLGHSYTAKVTTPTCTEQGYTTHTCSRCSDSYKDTYTNATGHSFGDWVVVRLPDENADGQIMRSCGCGKKETQIIDNNPFVDIPDGKYYTKPVLWAYYHGITAGKTETEFQPNESCTRKQIVTFLWRAAGSPEPASMVNPFTDVKSDRFEKAILWAYYEGITAGTTATTFSPEVVCTRKQIVTFLWRYQGCPQPLSGKNPFTDVKSDRFESAILWAYYEGITYGKTETTFEPEETCTRAQIVTFLYRHMVE